MNDQPEIQPPCPLWLPAAILHSFHETQNVAALQERAGGGAIGLWRLAADLATTAWREHPIVDSSYDFYDAIAVEAVAVLLEADEEDSEPPYTDEDIADTIAYAWTRYQCVIHQGCPDAERRWNSNLAKTAIYVLQDTRRQFNMDAHARGDLGRALLPREAAENECGTSCCLCGYGAVALPPFDADATESQDWEAFAMTAFGAVKPDRKWKFLFGGLWNNDRREAACRALTYMEKGVPEGRVDTRFRYAVDFDYPTDKQLIERLSKFVINDDAEAN